LLLGGASIIIVRRFKKILDLFIQVSGGLINHNKCQIYAWNVSQQVLVVISNIFHFPHKDNWSSFKYLGMPICLHSASSNLWQQVISKIKAKFIQWGAHWLNPQGEWFLSNQYYHPFHVFQYSSLLALVGIKQQIVQEIRRFLWQGGKTNSKRFHLVNWSIVRAPKAHGGLGIKDPTLMNLVMGKRSFGD
jgi:hypothetical protein